MITADQFNEIARQRLPGHLGIHIVSVDATGVRAELVLRDHLLVPNGYLHAGTVVSLADTCAGCGCIANLPASATGFTTIELKANHLATALNGTIECTSTPVHMGRNTQVWDATVTHRETGKTLALFRCTQMLLYPKA